MKICDACETVAHCTRAQACIFRRTEHPCLRPPEGWHCTRAGGHDGPCAAQPVGECTVLELPPATVFLLGFVWGSVLVGGLIGLLVGRA